MATAVAAVFLVAPALAGIPARLIDGCARWIASAAVLELLSALGFVLCFKLVFAEHVGRQRSSPAALRALTASTILPAGGVLGPATGAWSTSTQKPSVSRLSRSTIAFVVLTNAPGVIVLAGLGLLLGLGLPGGPHRAPLTFLPSLLATGVVISTLLAGRSPRRGDSPGRRRRLPRWLAAFSV